MPSTATTGAISLTSFGGSIACRSGLESHTTGNTANRPKIQFECSFHHCRAFGMRLKVMAPSLKRVFAAGRLNHDCDHEKCAQTPHSKQYPTGDFQDFDNHAVTVAKACGYAVPFHR